LAELGYLSVTAGACARMICVLLDHLPTQAFSMTEVQVSVRENAPAMAIVTLAAAMTESIVGHAEWERGLVPLQQSERPRSICDRLRDLLPGTDHNTLREDLREAFGVRDVIVHAHLWEGTVYDGDDSGTLTFVRPPALHHGYGRQEFLNILDRNTLCSRRRQLSLYPPRIWRRDAGIVLQLALDTADALESSLTSRLYFTRDGKRESLEAFRQRVRELADLSVPYGSITPPTD
jgi:hypothetical protein